MIEVPKQKCLGIASNTNEIHGNKGEQMCLPKLKNYFIDISFFVLRHQVFLGYSFDISESEK